MAEEFFVPRIIESRKLVPLTVAGIKFGNTSKGVRSGAGRLRPYRIGTPVLLQVWSAFESE
jgi:hypothetical protein